MGKLLKYELRKNCLALAVLLIVMAVLEGVFLVSTLAGGAVGVFMSMLLFALLALAISVTVFALGVSTYSRELSQKSSYLAFMIPRRPIAIVSAKLLFTLLAGVVFSALYAALMAVNFPVMMRGWTSPGRATATCSTPFEHLYGRHARSAPALRGLLAAKRLFDPAGCGEHRLSCGHAQRHVFAGQQGQVAGVAADFSYALHRLFAARPLYPSANPLKDSSLELILNASEGAAPSDLPLRTGADLMWELLPRIAQNAAMTLLSMFGCAWMLKRAVNL